MNGAAEFVLHSSWNIKPEQLNMQQMGQTTMVLLASTSDHIRTAALIGLLAEACR